MRLGGTPATIVVSKGTVVEAWEGAYMDARADEISRYFNVKLPGLIPFNQDSTTAVNAHS